MPSGSAGHLAPTSHPRAAIALAFLAILVVFAAVAPAAASGRPVALYAVFLDQPGRAAQARAEGLVLYSQISSGLGEVLLVGGPPGAEGKTTVPLLSVDEDTTGAAYYLARPPADAALVPWSLYGSVRLDLGDQVLLRARPDQAERLLDAGVKFARIALEATPWPALEPAALERAAAAVSPTPQAIAPDADVQAIVDQVSTDALSSRLAELTGAQPATIGGAPYTITSRNTYSGTSIQKAAQLVADRLQGLGLSVESHVWGSSGAPSTYPNVVGQITGTVNPGDVYVIGAHLDDVPQSGAAPGADDNASGSVATLLAAEILSRHQWTCTLRFAFWTGEEQGLLGSAAYARRASSRRENVRGYLNMDMIAYNATAPNRIDLFTKSSVPGSVAMADLFADTVAAYGLNLAPEKYVDDSMGNYSDNKSFWDQGYASIAAAEDYYDDFTPDYHTARDTVATLDMAYYTDAVKASLATFVHMTGCLVTGPPPDPPAAPANLTASSISSSQVALAWTDGDGETGYKIERCGGPGCASFVQIATLGANVTAYGDGGLAAATSYSYRVRAYNAGGDSDYSDTASATTQAAPTPPAAPSSLTASAASRTQINLAWTDNAGNETGFHVERCKGATCTSFARVATLGANSTGYASTGLSPNNTYRFRVRAYSAAGTSAYSNAASAKTMK